MISHRQLRHALSLFKHGSFTRAANAEKLSQSAFSRSIAGLERELGVSLYERSATNIVPTQFGEAFELRAATILNEMNELQREMVLMQGLGSGEFTVAMGIYPAEVSGNRALAQLTQNHPGLRCRALVGNWETVSEQVLSRKADIGFALLNTAQDDERFTTSAVSQHEMVLYCRKGHPLAEAKGLSKSDLDEFPLASIRVPAALAGVVPGRSRLDESSGYLLPSIEIDDFATARVVVSNSDAIGAAVPIQIQSQLDAEELVLLSYQRGWLQPVHGFMLLKQRVLSPATERFMEHVMTLEADASRRNSDIINQYLG